MFRSIKINAQESISRSSLCLLVVLGLTLLASPALAQVNGPGPSPSNTFDIVLNLPNDEAVITGRDEESIGGVTRQTTQLNVSDGGTVGEDFDANSGSEMNISGGTVGVFFGALSGSVVNISGGTFGDVFDTFESSVVNLQGSEFSIDGTPLSNLQAGQPFTITDRDVTLSGVLADGEPFSFDLNAIKIDNDL